MVKSSLTALDVINTSCLRCLFAGLCALGFEVHRTLQLSQSDLTLCAVVMWANSATGTPQIHRSLFLNGLLQATNKPREEHFDSVCKTFCGILKTQFVRTRKH